MLLKVCLTFGKPTAFTAKATIIVKGGMYEKPTAFIAEVTIIVKGGM